jgi:hypothetical protein
MAWSRNGVAQLDGLVAPNDWAAAAFDDPRAGTGSEYRATRARVPGDSRADCGRLAGGYRAACGAGVPAVVTSLYDRATAAGHGRDS